MHRHLDVKPALLWLGWEDTFQPGFLDDVLEHAAELLGDNQGTVIHKRAFELIHEHHRLEIRIKEDQLCELLCHPFKFRKLHNAHCCILDVPCQLLNRDIAFLEL